MKNHWIQTRIRQLKDGGIKKNQAGLARALGDDTTVVTKIIGGRQIQPDEFSVIAEYLELSISDVVALASGQILPEKFNTHDHSTEKKQNNATNRAQPLGITTPVYAPRKIPIRSIASANASEGEIMIVEDAVDEVPCPPGLHGVRDLYAIEVSGDCINDIWKHGDPVFASPNIAPRKDDVVVFTLKNGKGQQEAYVKILVHYDDKDLVVRQTNPAKEMVYSSKDIYEVHRVYSYRECIKG